MGIGSPPPELVELHLCRDIYHCTPVELAQVPAGTINRHLVIMQAEAQVRKLRR
jgi:hypothetical protein